MMNAPLWTGEELIAALGARLDGALPAVVSGASIDTRTLEAGDAFFAKKVFSKNFEVYRGELGAPIGESAGDPEGDD